jgi:hypothetical protein
MRRRRRRRRIRRGEKKKEEEKGKKKKKKKKEEEEENDEKKKKKKVNEEEEEEKKKKKKKKKKKEEEEKEDLYRYITLKNCVFAQTEIQLLPSGQTEKSLGIGVQNLMNCTANDDPTAFSQIPSSSLFTNHLTVRRRII